MQKSVKVLLTAVIAVSMCAAMAGCGESDDKGKTAPISTVSTEESAVSDTESSEEISEEESDENEEFAGTTKEKASALAVSEASKSFRAIYAAQKNDGEDVWKIILADESNSMLIAYVKGEECSFDTIEEKVFANTTESGAVSTALSNAGDGVWTAEETQMITYPNKKEFWQITLKSDSGDFKRFYINDADCFESVDENGNVKE